MQVFKQLFALGLVLFGLLSWPNLQAQIPSFEPSEADDAGPVVVATVNGEPIYLAEVHRYLRKLPATTDENLRDGEPSALVALIQRQLVLEHLIRKKFVSPEAVELQVEQRRVELAKRSEQLDAICEEQGISESALRRAIAWNIAWPKYLQKYLGNDRLRRYFEEHSAHFDGGSRDVSHILWKLSETLVEEERLEIYNTAEETRRRIQAGELSFADAAREHSDGPSAQVGGELGSIDRDGPMTEIFSEAAFNLKTDEMSKPVVDSFGVHLILCGNVEPGRRKFKEVRSQVEQAARAELFETVARRFGKNAEIKYTDKIAKP